MIREIRIGRKTTPLFSFQLSYLELEEGFVAELFFTSPVFFSTNTEILLSISFPRYLDFKKILSRFLVDGKKKPKKVFVSLKFEKVFMKDLHSSLF